VDKPGNLLENAFVSSVVAKPIKLGDFCARGSTTASGAQHGERCNLEMASVPPYDAVEALTRKSSPQAKATRQALTQVERMNPGLSRHSLSSAHLHIEREMSGTGVTHAMLYPSAAG